MLCLGIESTAHTFGAAVMKDEKVLSNEKKAFQTMEGGMIPRHVADHHAEVCDEIIKKALDNANVKIKDINLISFSNAPGLGNTLRIGCIVAKTLSVVHKIPLIGVNHCIAHLEIGRLLSKAKDPIFLYASGANTQIIGYAGGKYRLFGETLDIGIGNFLDTFARYSGLGFPGGPKIEELAKKSNNYISLPYSVKGMDVSFSGMLTNLKSKLESHKLEDLAYSAQETAFSMLIEVSERAMAHTGKRELLLGGGVACNKRLQEMANIMCKERNAECFILENQFNVDNAAMIAWLGMLEWKNNIRPSFEEIKISPYERTDEVDISWF